MPIFNHNIAPELALEVTAGAYASGDVVGGLLTFPVASAGGGGTLRRLLLTDDADQKAAMKLYLFNAAPSSIDDNAAFAPTIADLKKLIDVVDIAADDWVTANGNAYVIKNDLGIDYTLAGGNLYGYLVASGTPTYAATTDLYARLQVWAD